MKKSLNWKTITLILFVICIIYIILLKTVDVGVIGPNDSKVGFSTLNGNYHQMFPKNMGWYNATKYLGFLPFLIVAYYGLVGCIQLKNRKSLAKVDKKLILLGIFYILVGATYFFFEEIVINYRPVLMDGELEASFPSSHTMLAICVCASSILMSKYYIKDKKANDIITIITGVLMIVLVVGRFLSGVHWATDILGGILISGFLLSLFYSSLKVITSRKNYKVYEKVSK